MQTDALGRERRKHPRFKVKGGAFAIIPPAKIGPIVDISLNGLSFCYNDTCLGLGEASELDIFVFGSAFTIPRIPVIKVESVDIACQPFSGGTHHKRLGLEFGPLTLNQVNKLNDFMKSFRLVPDVT